MQLKSTISTKFFKLPHLSGSRRANYVRGLLYISPWLVGLIVFKLVPIIASLVLSTTNFFLLTPKEVQFVGLRNYVNVFTDTNAPLVLWRTIQLALWIVPVQTIAAILLAAILSNPKLRLKNTLRALYFIPSIIPAVAATFMWQGFVNSKTGWLNRLFLDPLGLASLNHLSSRGASQTLFIITSLWMIGPGFLIIMGAMQAIPTEILEAAWVDGASRVRRFFSIILPLVSPAIFFTLIINLTAVFGGAILLDRGHTFNSNLSSYDGYVYFVLFRLFKLGYASSLAWVFFVFIMLLVVVFFFTSNRWVYFPDSKR
jgi:ABC-type sugar transport system permease subunit